MQILKSPQMLSTEILKECVKADTLDVENVDGVC